MKHDRCFILIDNNVIGPWMRNHDFYARLYDRILALTDMRHEQLTTNPTAAGFLEFVGVVSPTISPGIRPTAMHLEELRRVSLTEKPNYTEIVEQIKFNLYEQLLVWVKQVEIFQVPHLQNKYDEKVNHLVGQSRSVIDSVFGSALTGDGIEFLHSRVALSYLAAYEIAALLPDDPELEKSVDASAFVDIGKVHQDSLNIPSVRGVERMWKNFSRILVKNADEGKFSPKVPLETLKANIDIATDHFTFKPERDHLDLEVVHSACLGKHQGGVIYPVVAITADPLPTLLYRIAAYRSFVRAAFEEFESLAAQLPLKPVEGHIIAINNSTRRNPVIEREIAVRNIPGLFPKLETTTFLADRYP